MKQLLFASLMCITSIGSLQAQQEGQNSSPTNTLITDMEFIIQTYEAGLNVAMFSSLAKSQGSSIVVQDFGKMTETYYNGANNELQSLAEKNNISLPTQLPIEIQTQYETMSGMSDSEFDVAFIEKIITDYKNLVLLFENEIENGQNEEIQLWAQRNLSKLKQHLNHAIEANMELKELSN